MPTVTGTTQKGRQELVTGLNAAITARILMQIVGGPIYRYWGYIEHQQVEGGRYYSLPGVGIKLYYDGVIISVPAITAPSTRVLVAYWHVAGVPWRVVY